MVYKWKNFNGVEHFTWTSLDTLVEETVVGYAQMDIIFNVVIYDINKDRKFVIWNLGDGFLYF